MLSIVLENGNIYSDYIMISSLTNFVFYFYEKSQIELPLIIISNENIKSIDSIVSMLRKSKINELFE